MANSSSQGFNIPADLSGESDSVRSEHFSPSPSAAEIPDPPPAVAPGRSGLGMPVADLVGLRFSVVHLRLGGYTLLGIWASEILGLLTSPLLWAIGPRLHYISQGLDLSPLLVVGIILVSFQGGLQRNPIERLLLPLLFGLLPVLAALHFLMAPASIANAVTLSSKQEEVNKAQLSTIESQLNRAGQALSSSQDLEDLRRRLDAIPGVRLSAKPNATLEQARQEVTAALLGERQRVRSRLGSNAAQARSQFVRRAVLNAGLATLVGLMLTWMRQAALREMELSSSYLAWVIVADPDAHNIGGIKDLAGFQKRCLATSYLDLIGRLVQHREQRAETEQESSSTHEVNDPPLPPPPLQQAPWEPRPISSEEWRRNAGLFRGVQVNEPLVPGEATVHRYPSEPEPTPRDLRRRARDRERMRAALENFATMAGDFDPLQSGGHPEVDSGRRVRRPSQRQLNRYRKFMDAFVLEYQQSQLRDFGHPMNQDNPDPSFLDSYGGSSPLPSETHRLKHQEDLDMFVGSYPRDSEDSDDDLNDDFEDDLT